jgi:hypothetical protein
VEKKKASLITMKTLGIYAVMSFKPIVYIEKPVAAKDELMWAGIGFGAGIVLYMISVAGVMSMY